MESLKGQITTAAEARAHIASRICDSASRQSRLGHVELKPHQSSALRRLRRALDEFGGALLCDPVGTGKTFVALGLTSPEESVLVVGPAVLRDMWMRAAEVSGTRVEFLSFESLSRGRTSEAHFNWLVVDEAHHVRNPGTRRYEMLSRLCCRTKVVCLTATPIHNRKRDLESLLALFMGERATTLSAAEVARCVIRRSDLHSLSDIPRTDQVIWCRISADDQIPALLLDLPPPLPPRDGGDGGVLVTHSLIRQWASSDAALIGGLRRRLVRGEALVAALEDGAWPSASELDSWISGDDSVQLAFTSLLAAPTDRSASLLPVVRAHLSALTEALKLARQSSSDDNRASVIRQLRMSHPERKVVVFSQYADTVDGMFMRLSRDGQVGALSGRGGRVAGGALSRNEVLERFAPRASGVSPPRAAEDISLLITTDLLSEGVNLQDAGAIIHLDLPWTPARIEQRLGRIARIGSQHETVISYAFRPPASAETVIRIETILKRKLLDAGFIGDVLPTFAEWLPETSRRDDSPLNTEPLQKLISGWRSEESSSSQSLSIATVQAASCGFLAMVRSADGYRLIGCIGDVISDNPAVVLQCARLCTGADAECSRSLIRVLQVRLEEWLASELALKSAGESSVGRAAVRNKAIRRIERIIRNSRLHERSAVIAKGREARVVLARTFGIHLESRLFQLCQSEDDDHTWLDRVIALGSSISIAHDTLSADSLLVALITFQEPSPAPVARTTAM